MNALRHAWLAAYREAARRTPAGQPPSHTDPDASSAAVRLGDDLLRRWSEPHRRYHTATHLTTMLAVIQQHAAWARDPAVVRLAAFFHDAIYDPRRGDNEEVSARLAEVSLARLRVSTSTVSEIARLVRLTATHTPRPGDRNGELLTDADLSILAADPPEYAAYARDVREEYAHVADDAFAVGRAAVLTDLLSTPHLFHVPALRESWEEPARHNLTAELATLSPPGIALQSDVGDAEDTGDAGDAGDAEDTGDAGDAGDAEDTGDTGDTGDAGDANFEWPATGVARRRIGGR